MSMIDNVTSPFSIKLEVVYPPASSQFNQQLCHSKNVIQHGSTTPAQQTIFSAPVQSQHTEKSFGENEKMCKQHTHNWQKLGIQKQLCVSYPHRHDQLSVVSSLISWNFWSANQHTALQQTVHVHRQHLHCVWKDELKGRESLLLSISHVLGHESWTFKHLTKPLLVFFDEREKQLENLFICAVSNQM